MTLAGRIRIAPRRFVAPIVLGASLLGLLLVPPRAPAAAGRLDRSFGGDGTVHTRFSRQGANANAVTIDAKGRIVAAGSNRFHFALARYGRSGRLDRSFGRDGRVRTNFFDYSGAFQSANDVVIDSRGRIVAAGSVEHRGFGLARYKPNGDLDRSFSRDGIRTTNFPGGGASATGVAIDGHGRIVAVGYAGDFPSWDFVLARYKPDGSLDRSFGTGGKVITDLGGLDAASDVTLDSRGRIVVAGGTRSASTDDFALVRYRRNGSRDPSFGSGGEVVTDFGGWDFATSVAIDGNGRIVAAGSAETATNSDFALARYDQRGAPDKAFGTGGLLTTDFQGRYDRAESVAIDSHGLIVATGHTGDDVLPHGSRDFRFALARYHRRHGAPDTRFSEDGKVAKPAGSALGAAIDSRDRIVAAGVRGGRFALARYIGR